uniref:Uncharacterized protein ycf33 n=1 Tax=Asparagopsis taxiformis TaxID=260499 RepID=A0A1C9CCG8_9FLOR|nr:hypothetical protein Aspa_165 [Asparagopsis taxiformis]AOM66044.1 hypothetical protein Aspa_165 [Asparagopsis taxiformis]
MHTFWNNINKFPRFLISVILGFFLTIFYPIFKLLKNKKNNILFLILLILLIILLYIVLKLMVGLNTI